MPNTVKVPLLGTHNKGTVIGVTIGGFAVAGYLIVRGQRKKTAQAQAVTDSQAVAQAASGYGYGTGTYPSGYYGYGEPGNAYGYGASGGFTPTGYYGYGVPNPPSVPITTNAQWDQAAINQLEGQGYNPRSVSEALGAYLSGVGVTPQQQTIIQAATGVEGYPPQPGTNGYPPKIHVNGQPGGGQDRNDFTEAPGGQSLAQIGAEHGDSRSKIDRLNPTLFARFGGRPIPKGTRVRIS